MKAATRAPSSGSARLARQFITRCEAPRRRPGHQGHSLRDGHWLACEVAPLDITHTQMSVLTTDPDLRDVHFNVIQPGCLIRDGSV
jgi:hypothetical protein